MNDLNQLLNDPMLCTQLQASGLLNYVGVALFPVVTPLVEYFKVQWPFTKKIAPVLSQIIAVVTNIGMGSVAGLPVSQSVLLGVVTPAITTSPPQTSPKSQRFRRYLVPSKVCSRPPRTHSGKAPAMPAVWPSEGRRSLGRNPAVVECQFTRHCRCFEIAMPFKRGIRRGYLTALAGGALAEGVSAIWWFITSIYVREALRNPHKILSFCVFPSKAIRYNPHILVGIAVGIKHGPSRQQTQHAQGRNPEGSRSSL